MSSDGTKLVAADSNVADGYLYASADSGATWTQQSSGGAKGWNNISISSDGKKLAIGTYDGIFEIWTAVSP